VLDLVAQKVQATDGRISAKRLLPIARAAGYSGSARNFRRAVASAKRIWKDVKEILVQWDAGGGISGIAHRLGYSRPTVRKYVHAGQRVGLARGSRRIDEVGWERAARAAIAQVAAEPRVGDASLASAAYHEHIAERVGSVRLTVLHQRLRDEQKLKVSWASFYRYARQHWPDRLRPAPRIAVRLDDPRPGEEAQIDYFYVGH
jgi:hypothetical protein